jgi:hypothetical protein
MTNPTTKTDKRFGPQPWIYAGLVTLIPAVVWLLFVSRFGLPVFYEDDWSLVPFIIQLRAATLHFADYRAPYGPLDPRPIMICSWLMATVSVVIAIRYLVWPPVRERGLSLNVLAGLAFSTWALSLVQYESQLWGFEISFIATLCCALLGASVLANEGSKLWVRLGLLFFIGTAATLTSGQGLTTFGIVNGDRWRIVLQSYGQRLRSLRRIPWRFLRLKRRRDAWRQSSLHRSQIPKDL